MTANALMLALLGARALAGEIAQAFDGEQLAETPQLASDDAYVLALLGLSVALTAGDELNGPSLSNDEHAEIAGELLR